MYDHNNNCKLVFSVTLEDLQEEAKRLIGRELNDDEALTATDCIDWGLSTSIFIVFSAAIRHAVSANKKSV